MSSSSNKSSSVKIFNVVTSNSCFKLSQITNLHQISIKYSILHDLQYFIKTLYTKSICAKTNYPTLTGIIPKKLFFDKIYSDKFPTPVMVVTKEPKNELLTSSRRYTCGSPQRKYYESLEAP